MLGAPRKNSRCTENFSWAEIFDQTRKKERKGARDFPKCVGMEHIEQPPQQNVTAQIPCPDKVESGDGKLWPVFWTREKPNGRLLSGLTPAQIAYMKHIYDNVDANQKNPNRIRVKDWSKYFGVYNARQAIYENSELAGNAKSKKQKTSTPLPVQMQPTDIAGDFEGLRPETSAHNHDTVTVIPLVSPPQILTDDVKRKIEIGPESAVHQRVPVPKNL